MAELLRFFWSVLEQWAVLATGGVVMAVIAACQYYWQRTLSWRVYKWLMTGFAVAACFLAWREEHRRAERALAENARLQSQRVHDAGQIRQILQEENKRLDEQWRSAQTELDTLRASVQQRRLSVEQRLRMIEVLAVPGDAQIRELQVGAHPSCHECLIYVDELVTTLGGIPGWQVSGGSNGFLSVNFEGLGIGVKDPKALPPGAHVIMKALDAAKLPFRIYPLDYLDPGSYLLVVGRRP